MIGIELENNIFVKTIILFLSDLVWCEKQYIENIHILVLFWGFNEKQYIESIYIVFKYLICVETIFGERYDFIVLCVVVYLENNVLKYSLSLFYFGGFDGINI